MSTTPRLRRALTVLALAVLPVAVAATATTTAAAADVAPATSSSTFFDNFDGPAGSAPNAATWTYQTGGGWNGGRQAQQYTNRTANAALTGTGSLKITAKGETYTGTDQITRDYTSARLITKQSVLYGTVSARIRMTGSQGAFPAFWTMGANYAQVGWPYCGELDVMETVNQMPNLYGSFHGPVAGGYRGQAYNAGKMISPAGGIGNGWHTYSATWRPNKITFLLDGTPYATVVKSSLPTDHSWAMNNAQNIILNIAVGDMAGTPAPPAEFLATMEVAWVKVTNTTVA